MARKEKLKFDAYEVEIDPENLRFDEQSLSNYIQKESGWYDNFGAYLALSERHLQNKEVAHEKLYCERFVEAKENGASDKLAEAKAKADADVNELKSEIVEAKYVVNRLKNHLKAWDKNHDNAQSLGHTLRRQMDKLKGDTIYGDHGWQGSTVDKDVAETVTSFPDKDDSGFSSTLSAENLF